MLKLFGMCILFLSARIFYENIMDKGETDIKKTEDLILFANLIYINIMELKMPLPVAVASVKFKISPFIDSFCMKFSEYCESHLEKAPREAFIKLFSALDSHRKIKRELEPFLQIVGTADKETVLNYKNVAVSGCEKILSEHKKNFEKSRKTAGAMTFGVSCVLAVILI